MDFQMNNHLTLFDNNSLKEIQEFQKVQNHLYAKALYFKSDNSLNEIKEALLAENVLYLNLLFENGKITKKILKDIKYVGKIASICLTNEKLFSFLPLLPIEKLTAEHLDIIVRTCLANEILFSFLPLLPMEKLTPKDFGVIVRTCLANEILFSFLPLFPTERMLDENIPHMFIHVFRSVKSMDKKSRKIVYDYFYPLVKKYLLNPKYTPSDWIPDYFCGGVSSAFDMALKYVPISWRPMLETLFSGASDDALMIAIDHQGVEYFPFMEEFLTNNRSLKRFNQCYGKKKTKFLKYVEMKNEGTLVKQLNSKPSSTILTNDEIRLILLNTKTSPEMNPESALNSRETKTLPEEIKEGVIILESK